MTASLHAGLRPLPHSRRWPFWFTVAIAIKLSFAAFFLHKAHENGYARAGERFFLEAGDTDSYMLPAENLLRTGDYVQDPARPATRAGRMPGYSLTYLAFRAFYDQETAKSLLVLFQILLGSLSVYWLSLLAKRLLGESEEVFLTTFLLYSASTLVSQFDFRLLTESLAASSLICSSFFLQRSRADASKLNLVISGSFLTFSIFLRPFVVIVLPWFALLAWALSGGGHFLAASPRRVARTLLFLAPFVLCDGAWVARNYRLFGRFVPSQIDVYAGYEVPESQLSFMRFCQAVGEDLVHFKPNTLGSWFFPDPMFPPKGYRPPAHVFTSAYDLAALEGARERFRAVRKQGRGAIGGAQDLALRQELEGYILAYKNEKPWHYHLFARLRLLKILLVHSGPQNLPFKPFRQLTSDPSALFIKLLSVASYWAVVALGLLAAFRLWIPGPLELRIYLLVPLSLLFLLAFVLRVTEERYLVPAYPFLTMFAAALIEGMLGRSPHPGSRQT